MVVLWLASCAVDRQLVQVPVREVGSASEFSPESGVDVRIDRAVLHVADFRFEGPATASWSLPSLSSTAWAHPGHDFAGEVGGELVGTFEVDVLGEERELGIAECFEGTYATARFDLRGPVELEGIATVDGQDRPFRFHFEAEEDISGVPFEAVIEPGDPSVLLAIDLEHALSFVDWRTPDDDGDAVLTLSDGQIANTFTFGVHSTATYTMNLERP